MQVVILCGGKGTRSYPFTEYSPKAMMPIGGTPIIVHLMRIYAVQGFTNFILAAGHRQEILRDYFERGFAGWNIQIVDTGSDTDTAQRLERCARLIHGRFFVTYGDGVGNVNLGALLNFHKAAGGLATLTTVPLRSQYGTVAFDSSKRVCRFEEKPVIADRFINAGFFVFEPAVFRFWRGSSLEQDVLPALAERGELYSYLHHGFWKSMDTSKDQQDLEKLQSLNGSAPWLDGLEPKTAATNTLDLALTEKIA